MQFFAPTLTSGGDEKELVFCDGPDSWDRCEEKRVYDEGVPWLVFAQHLYGGGVEGEGNTQHFKRLPANGNVVAHFSLTSITQGAEL